MSDDYGLKTGFTKYPDKKTTTHNNYPCPDCTIPTTKQGEGLVCLKCGQGFKYIKDIGYVKENI